jgi:hypothetical protein
MSTKGTELTTTTREKIALSKTKHTKANLIESGERYINSVLNPPEGKIIIPSIVGFCLDAGISRSRLYELVAQWSEVADIVEYIEMLQEHFAIGEGFKGKASIFSMFLLKSKHQYHDQPQQLTQNNYMNISPDLLADALAIMNKDKK